MPNTLICPCCGENRIMESENGVFRCPFCRTSFRRDDEECLASSFRNLTFDLKKLGEDRVRIMLLSQKNGEGKLFRVFVADRPPVSGDLSADDWRRIASVIFCKAHFECWKQTSYDPDIVDGMMWNLTVSFERKHSMTCHGCNGYPPYWNDVIEALAFSFEAAGLSPSSFLSKRKEPS